MGPIILRTFSPRITLGIEMEWTTSLSRESMKRIVEKVTGEEAVVTGYQKNEKPHLWYCKRDSSCGYELATRKLGSLSSASKTIEDLELAARVHQALYRAGATADAKCGGHVHLGIAREGEDPRETDEFTLRWLLYWIKLEKFFMDLVPRRRVPNQFCRPHSGAFKADTLYTQKEAILRGFSHRGAVYLGSYKWGYTPLDSKVIEVRLGEGSNDTRDVKNWARCLLQMTERVRESPHPANVNWWTLEEALDWLGLLNRPGSPQWVILCPALAELREWILRRTAAYSKFKDAEVVREQARRWLVEWGMEPKPV